MFTKLVRCSRRVAFLLGLMCAALSAALGAAPAALASSQGTGATTQIQGSGSTWAYNAIEQWIQDVTAQGLQVVFSGVGSAQGRLDFAENTTDFGVSDIGYQGTDPATGLSDTSQGRAYAYLPVTAGGTSFPYHLFVGGKQVTNLRLSGTTIAKIFTDQITNWDSPEIQADMHMKHPYPSIPIIPVVHSEGSGDSAQFSRWLATDYPSIWDPFGGKTFTEYWPTGQGDQVAESGSDSVINYITSGVANGAIGYDEYSYALGANYPVVKVLNKAGYFTLPNQYNVAVALTKAVINNNKKSPDYLLQNLNNVYVNPAPQTYPLSSYSYLIEPTSPTDPKMTTAKRQTLADFLYYSLCTGQQQIGPIGYSPLPVNLVEAGFSQVAKLKQADPGVDLKNENVNTCHNPTFVAGHPSENYLAQIAPKPPACDKEGAGPCSSDDPQATDNGNPNKGKPTKTGTTPGKTSEPSPGGNSQQSGDTGGSQQSSSGGSPGSGDTGTTGTTGGTASTGTTGATGTTGSTGTTVATGTTGGAGGTTTGSTGGTTYNPSTGQTVSDGGTGTAPSANLAGEASTLPAGQGHDLQVTLAVLAGLLILGAIVLPPTLLQYLARRKAQ